MQYNLNDAKMWSFSLMSSLSLSAFFFLSLSTSKYYLTFTLLTTLGIAPNTMLSKVCSDKNKPNGQYRLPSNRDAVMEFVEDLPVRKVLHTLLIKRA